MKHFGDPNIDKFVNDVRTKAKENGINVFLKNSKRVKFSKNVYCSGYFSEDLPAKIVVAIDIPLNNWLGILVHESCHMDQYLENDPTWQNLAVYDTNSCVELDEWLSGVDSHDELISYHIRRIIDMEFNCEKRAVQKIKEYNLPIDIKEYIRKANAYIWFYSVVREVRKWNGKKAKSIYMIPELIELCPSTWTKSPYKAPKKFIDAMKKYYF